MIRLLAFGMLLILPATSNAQQRPPIREKLTKTYGLEAFGQIEAIPNVSLCHTDHDRDLQLSLL